MSRRILIAFILLFAVTAAIPTPEAADSSSSEESTEKSKVQAVKKDSSSSEEQTTGNPERNELFLFTLTAIGNMSKYGVEKGKTIVKGVLTDLDAVKANNPSLQTKLVNFTTFIDKSVKLEDSKEGINLPIMELFVDFCTLAANYTDEEQTTKTKNVEDTLILLSLQKNGIDEFGEELEKRISTFFVEFGVKIEKYFSTLNAEALKKEKLYEWYKDQKTVKDFEKLMMKFGDFFEYADDKSD